MKAIEKETSPLHNVFFIVPFVLALITFFIYWPTRHYGFLFDDVPNIMKFYDIRHATFKDLFFSRSRWLSAWLNTIHYKIGKFDPLSYRLFNIIMHSIAGIMVFFIFYLALSKRNKSSFFYKNRFVISGLTSLLFLLHPVQTQTVSYVIQGQLEGLAAFFTLVMILLFLCYCTVNTLVMKVMLYCALCIVSLFAVGTKDIIVVAPVLLLLTDWFFVARGNAKELIKKRWWLHLSVMAIIWGGYGYLLLQGKTMAIKSAVTNNPGNLLTEKWNDRITPYSFFISQFKVILHYITIFLWPLNISIDYDEKLVRSFFAPDALLPLLTLLALGIYSLFLVVKKPDNLIVFSIWWFFIVILPRSSWIPATELIADYKTYLASVGLLFLLACGIAYLLATIKKPLIYIALCLLFTASLAWASWKRNQVWRSGEALWGDVIKKASGRARGYNNYANALLRNGKFKDAIPYYKKALELEDHYPDAWVNLGQAYEAVDDIPKAFKAIEKALNLQKSPENYLAFGVLCMKLKRFDDAILYLKAAAEKYMILKKHEYGKAWYHLGRCYSSLGKHEEAWLAYRMACMKGDMDNETGFYAYGMKSLKLKKYPEALFALEQVIKENPSYENRYLYAYALLQDKQASKAEILLKKLTKERPNDEKVRSLMQQSHQYNKNS